MYCNIGVLVSDSIVAGFVEGNRLMGRLSVFPSENECACLHQMSVEDIVGHIQRLVGMVQGKKRVQAIGVGLPGVIRQGYVEECPHSQQLIGLNMQAMLSFALRPFAPVLVFRNTDVVAAGVAAAYGRLDQVTRVWSLGHEIGYGRYPSAEGTGEAGHCVVSLDPHETLCVCGGTGHLEGIMGHYAIRRRFFDIEPEEVFDRARTGDTRCLAFVRLWHRALAAATASRIHMNGPGAFFIGGPNARFIRPAVVESYLQEMVTLGSLQGSVFKVISITDELGVIGAALNASNARGGHKGSSGDMLLPTAV